MDATRFDQLARALARPEGRRNLLRFLTTLPLLGGLAALWDEEAAEAKGRRKRRRKRHRRGRNRPKNRRKNKKHKQKPTCKAKSHAKVCAGKCGIVKNKQTCKKKVDCGSCSCDPPCPVCQRCDEAARRCQPDPTQQGNACGDPGQVCQADGTCRCEDGSCAVCETCQSDGRCAALCPGERCCDGTECQPGDRPDACGTDGEVCAVCSGATPLCVDQACTACSAEHPCPSGSCCDAGQCVDACPTNETCQAGVCVCDCPLGCANDAVQQAIEAADAGASIELCPGTYGPVTINKNLTLLGAGEGDDPASNTILDAAGSGKVVTVSSGVTVSLQQLRITGGSALGAGGIDNAGTLSLSACTVAGNTAGPGAGGGVFNRAPGALTLTDCTVTDNEAGSGGGILQDSTGALTLSNTVVSLNTANLGGGIYVSSGVVNVTNGSTIGEKNNAEGAGGGIFVSDTGTVICDGSGGVTANTAGIGGGIANFGTVTLNGTPVTGNSPDQCAGAVPVAGCSE